MCGAKYGTSPFDGKWRVGTARFRVAANMEGQTSGGVRASRAVGPVGQQDDQQDGGVVEQVVSVPVTKSVITVSQLEYLSVRWKIHHLGVRRRLGERNAICWLWTLPLIWLNLGLNFELRNLLVSKQLCALVKKRRHINSTVIHCIHYTLDQWYRWELKRIHTCGCRSNERLKDKTGGSTRLSYTGLRGGLEHLQIEKRLRGERVESVLRPLSGERTIPTWPPSLPNTDSPRQFCVFLHYYLLLFIMKR